MSCTTLAVLPFPVTALPLARRLEGWMVALAIWFQGVERGSYALLRYSQRQHHAPWAE